MQVILLERIEKLGQMGQTVAVKPGYARNFLLPKKKALRATAANIKYFEEQKVQLEAHNLKRRGEVEQFAQKMGKLTLTLIRPASEIGQLYGSIRSRDIQEAMQGVGYSVEKTQIALSAPIKTLGMHTARLILHPEVHVALTIHVAQSEEEAAAQLEKEFVAEENQEA